MKQNKITRKGTSNLEEMFRKTLPEEERIMVNKAKEESEESFRNTRNCFIGGYAIGMAAVGAAILFPDMRHSLDIGLEEFGVLSMGATMVAGFFNLIPQGHYLKILGEYSDKFEKFTRDYNSR